MCDSGQSEKKKRYFVDNDDFKMYAGETVEECLEVIKHEIENLDIETEDIVSLTINVGLMTDEEVENLPEL